MGSIKCRPYKVDAAKEVADSIDYTQMRSYGFQKVLLSWEFLKAMIRVKFNAHFFKKGTLITTRCWCSKAEVFAGMFQAAGYAVKQRSPFMDFYEYLYILGPKEEFLASSSIEDKMEGEGYNLGPTARYGRR